ncbi:MAG TPA: PEP-CTERM sorting domain-containing protein [Bryobacteraceae bacterium]|nr:PEP-CTERM sorting domain-containing protein [Bryobacteraceae bacterium]
MQNFDSGGILIPSGPNYVNVAGNAGVLNTLTLNAPVQGVAFDLLGLQNASAAGFDGATIDFLNASNAVVGTMTINPVQVGTTNLAVQTVVFNSTAADITSIGFTKINTAAGQAMFGFDNLVLSSTAIPEPASVGLIGLGLVGAGLLRRRFNAR